jgi:hypothetical protein
MKNRIGFVSNSSSTSYIVAFKQGEPCPHCGRRDPNLVDWFEKQASGSYSDDTAIEETTKEGIFHEIEDWYSGEDNERLEEIKRDINSYSDEWQIMMIKISYHDSVTKTILDNMVAAGNVKIIRDFS